MNLTFRQKIMFIIFVIVLFISVVDVALSQSLSRVSLYTLLFLAGLYLDRSELSKYVVALAAAIMTVEVILYYVPLITYLMNINGVILIMRYVAICIFAITYYNNRFNHKDSVIIIIALILPSVIFNFISILNTIEHYNMTDFVSVLRFISSLKTILFNSAILIYTVLRYRRIN